MKCPYKGIGIIGDGKKVGAVGDRKMVHNGLSHPFHPNIGNFLDEVLSATPYKPDGFKFPFIIAKDGSHLDRFVDFCNHNLTKQLLLIQLPYHGCDLANDANIGLPFFNGNRFHGWMFGFQMYDISLFIKSLYGGFVIDEGNHNLPVIGHRLRSNEDKVSLLYVRLNHAVSHHPQKKGMVAAAYRSINGKVSFDIFYGWMRCACPDLSDNRNRHQFPAPGRRLNNLNRTGTVELPPDVPFAFKDIEVFFYHVGAGKSEPIHNFPYGWGIAHFLKAFLQK
jgi:hypothetical protein